MKKALIAMSGGVDSSVAALLMKNAGYECVGCTMKLYDNEDIGLSRGRTCCSLDDVADARSVAYRLSMTYHVFNFSRDFNEKIIDKFVKSYESGLTPNPCIDCNRYMKFDKLLDRADIMECEYLVTGHYARIVEENGRYALKKALDVTKDQSYVLYFLTQEQLGRIKFPLGDMRKTEIRELARENGFLNAEKPDSQDICFVPDGDYAAFMERRSGKKYPEGDFVDVDGRVIGRHEGFVRYTPGQRRGLGIAAPDRTYVCRVDPENNTVTVGHERDLYSNEAVIDDFNWISGIAPDGEIRCRAKVRYRQPEQPARAFPLEDGGVKLVFDEPQRAVTPGQAAVLYDGDTVLGGGTIRRSF